ncbi:MAG: Alkyl hydroperoxide reductase/ Thiol specific antioxidant/ Mal allergen, partial [Phycisphaerales bacterium]|nr:Alkyl hydroperoxide reductase/ Thiol specific antioxidant/ Mal allergen [Phycisphaerales bacterium]
YRGAVDDQFSEGAAKPKATHSYLRDALNDLLAGRPVANPVTKAHGCAITYQGPKAEDISYARDVAPVLQSKCVSCHSPGNVGPFAMSSYEKIKGWSSMIHEVLLDRRMPPWHADPHFGKFSNDRSLTATESQTLTRWIAAGCPRGEGADPLATASNAAHADAAALDAAPAQPAWVLGEPDCLVRIPRQEVPATGTVDYRYIDSSFEAPRDMWLRAAVTRPGNPKVVHHIIVRMRRPADYKGPPSESFLFTTWVPGLAQGECPPGTGLFVPKGARFNFEIHYTTDGHPHADESEVGLYVAKRPAEMLLEVRAAHTRELDIPAGQANAQHTATYYFKRDSVVYGLSPHMHLRGSWFKFELLGPDGHRETLLSVPSYDFNWQTSYRLVQPRHVPAGSWMLCTGGFDNSPQNPNNPDATKRVTWGLQTFDEMFMGFIDLAELPAVPGIDVKSSNTAAKAVKARQQ